MVKLRFLSVWKLKLVHPREKLKLLEKAGQDAHADIKGLMISTLIHGLSKKSGLQATAYIQKPNTPKWVCYHILYLS